MAILHDRIEALGGAITTRELAAIGYTKDVIEGALARRTLIRARRGWYVAGASAPEVLDAIRAGGRLACTSALAHHGFTASASAALHVEVPANASRLRLGGRTFVVHWAARPSAGDRRAVSIASALGQASRCRGASLMA
jgi:predicted transcriptional regulator of viral defense system